MKKYLVLSLLLLGVCCLVFGQEGIEGQWIQCGEGIALEHSSQRVVAADTIELSVFPFSIKLIHAPEGVESVVESVCQLWADEIETDQEINIAITWEATLGSRLAQTRPSKYYRNFSTAVNNDFWYPVALAEKLVGKSINGGGEADIEVGINENILWYYGIGGGGDTDEFDFMTVLLHELAHGLGFVTMATSEGAQVQWQTNGAESIYDHFLVDLNGDRLVGYNEESSLDIPAFLKVFDGSGLEKYQEVFPAFPFISGVSLSHWNNGDAQWLMESSIGAGEVKHEIEQPLIYAMKTLGWGAVQQEEIWVYPNPAIDHVTLQVPAYTGEIRYEIIDVSGRMVENKQLKIHSKNVILDLAHLSAGKYFILCHSSSFSDPFTVTLIVEK